MKVVGKKYDKQHLFLLKTIIFAVFWSSVNSYSQEKRIEKITFSGVKKTKIHVLQKILSSTESQVFDSIVLSEDMIRLKRLPAISNANFQTSCADNKCDVVVTVEENFTIIPEVNFHKTINQKLAYRIGVGEYNFLGRNISLGGFYQYNGFDSYGINFRAPTLFSAKWGVSLNHQNWISEEPLYFGSESANYKYQNISYEALALYQHNFKNQLQLGINFFKEKYHYLNGSTSSEVPTELNVDKKLLKLIYTFDNLDYNYQYINGFKNEFHGQYVTSENKYQDDFLIFWNDFFYFKRLGKKGNWANRLRVGLSSNDDTPFAPFALDNNLNLRGVGILVDRGTGSIVCNTEYRHTLYEKKWFVIQSNVFVDAGTWRNPGGSFDDFINSDNMKVYSGIGLRFINKKILNAIFRIDYGHGLTKNASKGFVFGIGQYF
ncbi:outer membrane protein assembly factor [Tenacibaculum sp. 1_MG-2023]|uniref:POTRA domain-containing protein n=1 Tax=Tenacibaculum sp. 1_MG-2023 TaxID=3062653 RepID=UPI0026E2B513|nr:POTRA domain-containing protein [Tenacibaculum sp. 1_MG-2023]MDO6674172.1 outer membrane protein assembly factor [Tenacibaculum sp. 1_MG-2023]